MFSRYASMCWTNRFPNLCAVSWYLIVIVFIFIVYYYLRHYRKKEL